VKFGAIDIGSNAVRLLIEEAVIVKGRLEIRKVSLIRVPIRLGDEVFSVGTISEAKKLKLAKAMKAFWYLMDLEGIEYYRAAATSAMREASNSKEVVQFLKEYSSISVDIINGDREATLIFSNFKQQKINLDGDYLYIDVGGGSTEITLIKKGKRVKARSFKIGTVRMLEGKVADRQWVAAKKWIQDLVITEDKLIAIGTGGNINRIFKEVGRKYFDKIQRSEIWEIHDYIAGFSIEDRLSKLLLKPDRADVIVPAAEIYGKFMEYAQIDEMIVPRVGLADGLVLEMAKDWTKNRLDLNLTPRLA
jgi:exopolyphosphatase/guanosine-5'-triphosphate,3'-diphosphate pyrophosphatase